MGKRSDFERKPRDFYPTPFAAVEPLIDHLPKGFTFAEPCAGDGQLCRHLEHFGGDCMWASDIEPQLEGVLQNDYTEIGENEVLECQYIITNPPWDRKLLHPIIEHLSDLSPTWLLFDADWIHTKQSRPYQQRLQKIVSVGRVKWIPDSKMTGKDNCCWYLFNKDNKDQTVIYGKE